MGKWGDLHVDDPGDVADRVVNRWAEVVRARAEEMGDKYLQKIRSADTARMQRLLREWYEHGLPQFASEMRNVWARRAPAPVRR